MTPDIVTEARQLLDAATPGPWYCFTDDSAGKDSLHLMSEYDDGSWVEGKQGPFPLDPFTYDPTPMERATAHFIAAAPWLVTELVAEVERLRTALDAAQLRSIEARNPGIDMDEVRRLRDRAGYQIVPKAERPSVCPTCRSHNPRIAGHWNGYLTRPCPDPWHGGAE